jgi:hypothetical protein
MRQSIYLATVPPELILSSLLVAIALRTNHLLTEGHAAFLRDHVSRKVNSPSEPWDSLMDRLASQ